MLELIDICFSRDTKHILKNINLKIDSKKCCAAGDYYNDLEVLKTSGYSGVPYEAPDDIKSAADEILCSVKKGCVGDFIDRLENRIKNSYN